KKEVSMPTWPNRPTAFYLNALSDPNSRMRRQAVAALEVLNEQQTIEPIIHLLGTDENAEVRANAARALGRFGDKRAVEALIKALHDPAREVCHQAILALEHFGDQQAVEPLIALLQDSYFVYDTARLLGKLGDARAVGPLMEALKHADSYT